MLEHFDYSNDSVQADCDCFDYYIFAVDGVSLAVHLFHGEFANYHLSRSGQASENEEKERALDAQ